MSTFGASYNFYLRNGVYYVRFRNSRGTFGSGINTKKKNERDAMLVITDWLKNGIPTQDTKSPQPIDTMLEVKDLIAGIRKASLSEKDAATIVAILKERKLIDVSVEKKKVPNTDFIIWLENFWDYDKSPYIEDKRLHNLRIGKRHAYDMQGRVLFHWKPFFEGRSLESITKNDLKTFSLGLAKKTLAATTINKIMLAGIVPLKWAKENEIITNSPFKGLMPFSGVKKKRGILEIDEAVAIFSEDWKDERCKTANMVASTTGLRAGEIIAIKLCDIGEDRLFVNHSWSEKDGLKGTKTNEPREVPLLPDIRDKLLELEKTNPHGRNGFIFYSTKPERPMDGKLLSIALRNAFLDMRYMNTKNDEETKKGREKALAEWKKRNICFHSWRHFYSSRMADIIEARKVMLVTGHKTPEVFQAYADHAKAQDFNDLANATKTAFQNLYKGDQIKKAG